MKKWNTPEIVALNINETAAVTANGFCQYDQTVVCIAKGNGGGQCNNCSYNPGGNKSNGTQTRGEESLLPDSDLIS